MKTDRLKKLLIIVRYSLNDSKYRLGICNVIGEMYDNKICTLYELEELKRHLNNHRPTVNNRYKEFMDNPYWLDRGFWWCIMADAPNTRQIRIDYLTAVINNLK